MERKNSDAKCPGAGYEFKVGDRIKVLRPRRVKGIPQKALTQWRGPYTVTAVKGARIKCRRMDGGAEFLVGRPHVQLYTAGQVDLATAAAFEAAQPSAAAAFAPGQLIAIGDHDPEDVGPRKFQLAQFEGFSDDDPEWLSVTYWGTVLGRPPYRFRRVWIDRGDNDRPILSNKKPRGGGLRGVEPWSGTERADFVLKLPIKVNHDGKLSASTLAALGDWTPNVLT